MRMQMKVVCFLIVAMLCTGSLAAQTLADRARELRKEKRTPSANEKVYTNESLSLRPAPAISEKSGDGKAADAKPADKAAAAEAEEEAALTPDEQKAALAADLKGKIDSAKSELATLQRELEIASREQKLRTAQYYADAGNRLRDERKFVEEENRNRTEMAEKQKKITETSALIENLRSQARRAGIAPGLIP